MGVDLKKYSVEYESLINSIQDVKSGAVGPQAGADRIKELLNDLLNKIANDKPAIFEKED